jgi:hypothetical protein
MLIDTVRGAIIDDEFQAFASAHVPSERMPQGVTGPADLNPPNS